MKLEIPSFPNDAPIPGQFAFCIPADEGHVTFAPNRSPHLRWSGVPAAAESLAVIVVDPDVPSVPDDVNQEGRTVPHDLPRVDFYHWVLVDIPIDMDELLEGIDSDGVTEGGKAPGPTSHGVRGINNYTDWFAGDEQMGATTRDTTGRARHGTTSGYTITGSPSTPSTCRRSGCREPLGGPRPWPPWRST